MNLNRTLVILHNFEGRRYPIAAWCREPEEMVALGEDLGWDINISESPDHPGDMHFCTYPDGNSDADTPFIVITIKHDGSFDGYASIGTDTVDINTQLINSFNHLDWFNHLVNIVYDISPIEPHDITLAPCPA